MAYHLYDVDGYVADVATITGYRELSDFVHIMPEASYALRDFLNKGETEDMEAVVSDIDKLLPVTSNDSIKSTLEDLRKSVSKAKEIAIISQ